jgi:hypothetical protein
MTPSEITRWANSATIGESITYAVGDDLNRTAAKREAWYLHLAGRVALVQRRLPNGMIQYEAQRINGKPALVKESCERCAAPLAEYTRGGRCRKCRSK